MTAAQGGSGGLMAVSVEPVADVTAVGRTVSQTQYDSQTLVK